jgi:hypothetical protein
MSVKNWKNGHYGNYEDPYSIRFGFYKSGYPKIELYKWEERQYVMTVNYTDPMPDNHVAIDLNDEVAIGRLYHAGLIVDSETVETVQWGPRRRVGVFPLTFAGIGELGRVALDQRFGFDFQTIDLYDLGDTTIRGPGMRKYQSGHRGKLTIKDLHTNNPSDLPHGFLNYAVEKINEHWGYDRGTGIVIESIESDYFGEYAEWVTKEKVRDCILDEMVNLHGVAIPEHHDPSRRWSEFTRMVRSGQVPPLHLHAGVFKLKYREFMGDHRCTDHAYSDWYRYFKCLSLYRVKEEDLQESSAPVRETVDTVQAEPKEEPVKELNLKNQEWEGSTINLDIEAKKPNGHQKNIWYKVTGKEAEREVEILFTKYTFINGSFPNSGAIMEGDNHEKIVKLLYNAGIITREKTGGYTLPYPKHSEWRFVYYRLTDQAIAYANRKLEADPSSSDGESIE